DQDDVAVEPALDVDRREAEPLRVVGEQRPFLDEPAEDVAQALDAREVRLAGRVRRAVEPVEPEAPPDLLVHLDDERRLVLRVRISVYLDDAVRRVEDEELERVVGLVDGEPDELAGAFLDARLEDVRALRADGRIDSV